MRSFSGTRSGDKKKGFSASEIYKRNMAAKNGTGPAVGKDEMYKKMMEDKMAKMMEDYLLGKRKNAAKLPGTKAAGEDEKPKEPSKNALMMIKFLAMKRAAKDRKELRKREMEFLKEQKNTKLMKDKKILEEEDLRLKKELEYKEEEEKKNAYWNSGEKKDSWW